MTELDYELKPALCLDFDGTIRRSKNGNRFIKDEWDIELIPGVEEIIREYKEKGYLIVGITNQGGVAFGYRTKEQIEKEINATLALFEKDPFDLVQVSFNHEKGSVKPYNARSLLRKPDIGMLVETEVHFFARGIMVDWKNSMFVGDREDDQKCALNAGIDFQWAKDFFGFD